jgi:hypothetical protein
MVDPDPRKDGFKKGTQPYRQRSPEVFQLKEGCGTRSPGWMGTRCAKNVSRNSNSRHTCVTTMVCAIPAKSLTIL